jgi:hypothetical protein
VVPDYVTLIGPESELGESGTAVINMSAGSPSGYGTSLFVLKDHAELRKLRVHERSDHKNKHHPGAEDGVEDQIERGDLLAQDSRSERSV